MRRHFRRIGAACLILLGIGMILLVVPESIRMRIIYSRYQPAPGKVIATSINDMGDPGSTYPDFEPVIQYEYTVDGIRYVGDTYQVKEFGNRTGFREWAEKVVSRYPVGKACTVYYNPRSPDKCTLVKPNLDDSGLMFFCVLGLGIIGIAAGIFEWRRTRLVGPTAPPEGTRSPAPVSAGTSTALLG
jgi:hypothetical protein